MAGEVQTLKSYLVGLGFDVNQQQFKKFENTLASAAKTVSSETASIGASVLKWQLSIVGMFGAVSVAVLGTIDKVANADQEYRLFGERMFMTTAKARSLKVAMDALGQPPEAIDFDPELHSRFLQLQKDQQAMQAGLGGDFESNMRGIRDFTFELTRLKVELQYLAMGTVNEIFKALGFGAGGFLQTLRQINDWIIHNIPYISEQIATYLVPILKDTWRIAKDIAEILALFATEFTNVISVLSGDNSIATASFNMEKFAKAVEHVVSFLDKVLKVLLALEKHSGVLTVLGFAGAGAAVGSIVPGVGTLAGAGVGAALGALYEGSAAIGASRASRGTSASNSGIADAARQLAKRIGADTGADPALIFGQMAFETNNFAHIARRNNLAGITGTSGAYESYGSLDEFGDAYEKFLSKPRYAGIWKAKTPEEWAHILKHGGQMEYYAGAESAYGAGIRNYMPSYSGGGSQTHISVGDINVMQPNASADQIANHVINKIQDAQSKQTQRNLAMFTPAFQ